MHRYFCLMIFTTISSNTTAYNINERTKVYFIHIYEATTGCSTRSLVSAGSGCVASPFSSTGLAFLPLPGGGG